jgi:glyoxylase-like metal-dependent hydrolase (beta-lactamase superfamily II)
VLRKPDLDWFNVRSFEHGIHGIGEPGHFEDVKSFLVVGSDLALLVDSGMGFADVRTVVESLTDHPVILVNSHGHLDHIGDNWRFDRIWAHPGDVDRIQAGIPNDQLGSYLADAAFTLPLPALLERREFSIPGTMVERLLQDGDEIDCGDRQLTVLHTPGHSQGSISLFEPATGILFAGDLIYEGPLFAQHPGGSAQEYRQSLQRLQQMISEISIVYPSHNNYPLPPESITLTHQAMEEIWAGRSPDLVQDGLERFEFERFSFTFRSDWREEQERSTGQ